MNSPGNHRAPLGYLAAKLFASAALMLLLGGIAFGVYLVSARPTGQSLLEVKPPGKAEVHLSRAGRYNLYAPPVWKGVPEGFLCSVRPKQSDRELSVKREAPGSDSFWQEPGGYTKFGEFSVELPGVYVISTSFAKSRVPGNIYVGRMYEPDFTTLFALLLGAGAAFMAGRIVFGRTLSARRRAIASRGDSLIYREPGIEAYGQVLLLKKKFSALEINKEQITGINKTTKITKTSGGVPGRVNQGVEIKYSEGRKTRSVIFWSEARDRLFAELAGAGYRTVWTPT